MSRREEIAFHHKNGNIWIAYRYSGGDKEEVLFVEGWNMEGKTGGDLYSTLRRILDVQFGRNDDDDVFGLMQAPFLSCDHAYIHGHIPEGIRVVLEEFLTTHEIPYGVVRPRTMTKQVLNKRWAKALGQKLKNTELDNGHALALSTLTKGVANAAVKSGA